MSGLQFSSPFLAQSSLASYGVDGIADPPSYSLDASLVPLSINMVHAGAVLPKMLLRMINHQR